MAFWRSKGLGHAAKKQKDNMPNGIMAHMQELLRPEWMRGVRRQVSKNLWLHFVALGEDPGILGILESYRSCEQSIFEKLLDLILI